MGQWGIEGAGGVGGMTRRGQSGAIEGWVGHCGGGGNRRRLPGLGENE